MHTITWEHLCTHLKHERRTKKNRSCLIKKPSGCMADHTSKTFFYLSLSIKHKDLMRKSCVFIYFIDSEVKIALYFTFTFPLHKGWQTSTNQKKKKIWMMEQSFFWRLYLNWNILLVSFWHKIISCFKLKSLFFLSTVATI